MLRQYAQFDGMTAGPTPNCFGDAALDKFLTDPLFTNHFRPAVEIARNVVESQRLSTLIDYATATPFAIGFLETALAIEDNSNGIWR